MYTNKRSALASPAKGGTTVVDLTAMDDGSNGGVKNSKGDPISSGKAEDSPQNQRVGASDGKPPTKPTTTPPALPLPPEALPKSSSQTQLGSSLGFIPPEKPTILISLPEALPKFHGLR